MNIFTVMVKILFVKVFKKSLLVKGKKTTASMWSHYIEREPMQTQRENANAQNSGPFIFYFSLICSSNRRKPARICLTPPWSHFQYKSTVSVWCTWRKLTIRDDEELTWLSNSEHFKNSPLMWEQLNHKCVAALTAAVLSPVTPEHLQCKHYFHGTI